MHQTRRERRKCQDKIQSERECGSVFAPPLHGLHQRELRSQWCVSPRDTFTTNSQYMGMDSQYMGTESQYMELRVKTWELKFKSRELAVDVMELEVSTCELEQASIPLCEGSPRLGHTSRCLPETLPAWIFT